MANPALALEVKQWLSECIYGILSTHTQDVPGYPYSDRYRNWLDFNFYRVIR